MISHEITAADVVQITGISRHKLRSLLKSLPDFSVREANERIASEYSLQDLAVLSVCVELEERFGLRRDFIAPLTGSLRKVFSGVNLLAGGAYLVIVPKTASVKYFVKCPEVQEGLVFPLDQLAQRIDKRVNAQGHLSLGPVLISRVGTGKGATLQVPHADTHGIRRAK